MSRLAFFCVALSSTSCLAQNYELKPYASGFDEPIAMAQDPARRNVQYVIEQSGLIKVLINGIPQSTPFLNLSSVIVHNTEQGLLGIAFPPDYATSGFFYVNMTTTGPTMTVARFSRSFIDPNVADPNTMQVIVKTPRLNSNHNAGTIAFGPDNYLYIPMGDGGGAGDALGNAQNPNTLLGKMIRIEPRFDDFPADPDKNYRIPTTNPFFNNVPIAANKEIWAFGLRNPFKFSFDDANLAGTGAMVIGDVGQDDWEEIDYQPSGRGGNNYGWKRFEGFNLFSSSSALAYGPETKPAYVYNHTAGVTVIGGRVYRGLELGADAFGRYFFSDFSNGRVWSMTFAFDSVEGRWKAYDLKEHTASLDPTLVGFPVSFDADSYGEMYLVNYAGSISKFERSNTSWVKEFTIQSGRIASGAVRNLIGYDDKFLQIENSTVDSKDYVITAFGRSTVTSRVGLDVDVVGSMTTGTTGLLRISLKRWSDGQWVQVSAQNMDSVKRRFRLSNLSATSFVRTGDGRMELKLDVKKNGTTSALTRVLWDQVVLKVR